MDIYADRSSFIIKWNNDDNEPALCAAQASSAASAASSGDTGVHAFAEAPLLGATGGTLRSSLNSEHQSRIRSTCELLATKPTFSSRSGSASAAAAAASQQAAAASSAASSSGSG